MYQLTLVLGLPRFLGNQCHASKNKNSAKKKNAVAGKAHEPSIA